VTDSNGRTSEPNEAMTTTHPKRRGADVPGGDPDTTYVFSRAEDRSPLMRASFLWEKYRLIIYGVLGYLLASGYEWRTPAQHNSIVRAQIDSLGKMIRVEQQRAAAYERKLDILIRFRCIEIAKDPTTAALIDLDCDSFLRWRPDRGVTPQPGGQVVVPGSLSFLNQTTWR
jgi:hypothetical protein